MRRLYADKLVIISAVLIVLFSALFALVQTGRPGQTMEKPHTQRATQDARRRTPPDGVEASEVERRAAWRRRP